MAITIHLSLNGNLSKESFSPTEIAGPPSDVGSIRLG